MLWDRSRIKVLQRLLTSHGALSHFWIAFGAATVQAIPVRSLPLSSDAERLQFAFALWAEELAATVVQKAAKAPEAAGKRAAEAADGGAEQVATSSERPAKKSKA